MQMKRYLGVVSVFAGTFPAAGISATGGANDRLDAEFVVEDTECANRGGAGEASFAFFDVEGTRFGLSGYASGTGTDGDYVEIYLALFLVVLNREIITSIITDQLYIPRRS